MLIFHNLFFVGKSLNMHPCPTLQYFYALRLSSFSLFFFLIWNSSAFLTRNGGLHQSIIKTTKISSWIDDLNIKVQGVEIADFSGLRGVKSTTILDGSNPIVSMKSNLALEIINNRPPTPFADFCPQSIWVKSMWDNRLAFLLLNEIEVIGNASPRKIWFEKLPLSFSTPFHWTEQNVEACQYQEINYSIARQKNEWRKFYDEWKECTISKDVQDISFDRFVWAHECVKSRAFSGTYEGSNFADRKLLLSFTAVLAVVWPVAGFGSLEQSLSAAIVVIISILIRDIFFSKLSGLKRYVMCPFIDMFNHRSDCISDVSYSYFTGELELRTQPYRKDEQVFINYGRQSNDRFLQYYGFIEPNNPVDVYNFGKGILELIFQHGDTLAVAGLLPASPSPEKRLRAIAQSLQRITVPDPAITARLAATIPANVANTRYYRSPPKTSEFQSEVGNKASDIDRNLFGNSIISRFDEVTVRALRALLASSDEWKQIVVEGKGEEGDSSVNFDKLITQTSGESESNVVKALKLLCQLELAGKPTTVDEDKKELIQILSNSEDMSLSLDPSGTYSDNYLAALSFRIEKKSLLLEATAL